jgi:hypothetical protein
VLLHVVERQHASDQTKIGLRLVDAPGCLHNFSASISGASAGVRLPCGGAAG